jgi:hypothetical protein
MDIEERIMARRKQRGVEASNLTTSLDMATMGERPVARKSDGLRSDRSDLQRGTMSFVYMHWNASARRRMPLTARSLPTTTFGVALLIALAFYAPPRSVSSSHGNTLCGPAKAKTLAKDYRIRVYAAGESGSADNAVYTCLNPSGPARRLGPIRPNGKFFAPSMPGPFGLAAPWAGGFEKRGVGRDGFYTYVAALNIRTAVRRFCFVNAADRPHPLPHELLINRSGVMAWAVTQPGSGGRTVEIGACEAAGRRTVAEGTGIEVESATLRGSTLSWMDSGVPQSVVLTP